MQYLRSRLLLALLSLAIFVGACSPDGESIPTRLQSPNEATAFLRVVHAAHDAPAVAVYAGSSVLFGGVMQEYLTYPAGVNEAKYYPVDTSAKMISFRGAAGTLSSAPVEFQEGARYTAYLYGREGGLRTLVTIDTVAPPPTTANTVVRIVHLAPDADELDVKLGESADKATSVATGIPYGTSTDYITREAGSFPGTGIYLFDSKTATLAYGFNRNVVLPGSSIFTIVMTNLRGSVGNPPIMTVLMYQESRMDASNGLFGGAPRILAFAGFRLANLIQTHSA